MRIEVAPPATTAKTITQRFVSCADGEDWAKRDTSAPADPPAPNVKNAIIFCNRKRDVAVLHKSLVEAWLLCRRAAWRHGPDARAWRRSTTSATGESCCLPRPTSPRAVSTFPTSATSSISTCRISADDYVHRIGRTGRAGREGFTAMIVTPKEMKGLRAIELLCKAKIEWIDGEPSTENLRRRTLASAASARAG